MTLDLESKGLRKLLAFLVIALISVLKLNGPELVQALTWSFAILAGGNGLEHFARSRDATRTNTSQ